MAVNLSVPGKLLEVPGIQMGTARTGIKSVDRDDIAVFSFAPGTTTAGVYTQSSLSPLQYNLREKDKRTAVRG